MRTGIAHQVGALHDPDHPVDEHRLRRGASIAQSFVGVLAHGLEEPVTSLVIQVHRLHEVVVDERDERLDVRPRDGRRRRHGAPDGKTAIAAKTSASRGSRRFTLHASVSRRVCWRAGRSRGPPVSTDSREASRSSSIRSPSARTRAAASSIGSGSPSSRWQHRGDELAGGGIERERRVGGRGTGGEQSDGIFLAERRDGEDVLARHVEDRPGRRDDHDARRRGEQPDEVGTRRPQVFEVVEQQQLLASAEGGRERGQRVGAGVEIERSRDRRQDERRVDEGRQLDQLRPVRERSLDLPAELQREPGLAAAAGARQ